MASVVERVRAVPQRLTGPVRPTPATSTATVASSAPVGLRARLGSSRTLDALHLVPLLALTAAVHLVGLAGAPRRTDAEGALVGAAWATLHPETDPTGVVRDGASSLARLELAAWLSASGSLGRAPHAVGAGRELVVLAAVVSAALVWVLARRLRLPRWAAAVAVLLLAAAPTAVELQRSLSAVGLALPWVLGAFVLALSRERVPAALVASTACLVVAGLIEPATLLVLPGLALVLWRRRAAEGRAVDTAAWLLVIGVDVTTLFVVLSGSPVVTVGVVGPVTGPGVLAGVVLGAGTLAALVLRRLRPIGITAGVLLVGALVAPGALPGPAAALAVPFGVLAVVGVFDGFLRYRPTRLRGRSVHRAGAVVAAVVALALVGAVAPGWVSGLRELTGGDADRPLAQAVSWVERSVPVGATVLTGAATRVDLLRQGREPGSVGTVATASVPDAGRWWLVDADPGSEAGVPPALREARARGTVVASFGAGAGAVEVLRVEPVEPVPDEPVDPLGPLAEAAFLLTNPAVTVSAEARRTLEAGEVDARLVTLLALLASRHDITLDAFPQISAGQSAGQGRLAARITEVDGTPAEPGSPDAADLAEIVDAQVSAYRAYAVWFPAVGDSPPTLVVSVLAAAT